MTQSNNKKGDHTFSFEKLNQDDLNLIEAAITVLKANFHPLKHQIGCAIRTGSGKIYSAVNIGSSIYGPCAEVVALGAAISNGERNIVSIVAVKKVDDKYPVLSPCGSCRQLMLDYAHNATVLLNFEGQPVKAKATDLLPGPYENSFTTIVRSTGSDIGR